MKCKRKTEDKDRKVTTTKNGRSQSVANCAVCGTKKSVFISGKKDDQQGGLSLSPRQGPSPSVRAFLEKYGEAKVLSVKVARKPISSAITKVLDLMSLGKFSKQQAKLGYDSLFHLYVYVNINLNGRAMTIRLEKNAVVSMQLVTSLPSASDRADVRDVGAPTNVSLSQFIANGEKSQGANFWLYDASNNNCQVFIASLLRGNRLLTESLKSYILQDAEALLTPMLKKVSKTVTDIAGTADRVLNGEGAD